MNLLEPFNHIRCFVFDVDGVLTDGRVYLMGEHEMVRSMHTKDGYALQLAIKQGYWVWIISGARQQQVVDRLYKLGVTQVFMGVEDKAALLKELMEQHRLVKAQVLFMGDDVPDIEAMQNSGLACAPADACVDVLLQATYVSPYRGGEGCVREVIEKVMKLQDTWKHQTAIASR